MLVDIQPLGREIAPILSGDDPPPLASAKGTYRATIGARAHATKQGLIASPIAYLQGQRELRKDPP
jgi:hypothetical protein